MDDLSMYSWTSDDWYAYRREHVELVRLLKKVNARQKRGIDVSEDVAQLSVRTTEWETKKEMVCRWIAEFEDPMMREVFERAFIQFQQWRKIEYEMRGNTNTSGQWPMRKVNQQIGLLSQRVTNQGGAEQSKLACLFKAYRQNTRYCKALEKEIEHIKIIRKNWQSGSCERYETLIQKLEETRDRVLLERSAVQALLDEAGPEDREMLYRYYITGETYGEMAEVYGVDLPWIDRKLVRARIKLSETEMWQRIKKDLDLKVY